MRQGMARAVQQCVWTARLKHPETDDAALLRFTNAEMRCKRLVCFRRFSSRLQQGCSQHAEIPPLRSASIVEC